VVEPRRAGLSLSINPVDPTGGQATAGPAGFVEDVHPVPGQPQRTCTSGPGHAGANDSDVWRLAGRHGAHSTFLRFIMSSVLTFLMTDH
jgi:hypothetical protein